MTTARRPIAGLQWPQDVTEAIFRRVNAANWAKNLLTITVTAPHARKRGRARGGGAMVSIVVSCQPAYLGEARFAAFAPP